MYGINGILQQSDYAETKKEVLLRWRFKGSISNTVLPKLCPNEPLYSTWCVKASTTNGPLIASRPSHPHVLHPGFQVLFHLAWGSCHHSCEPNEPNAKWAHRTGRKIPSYPSYGNWIHVWKHRSLGNSCNKKTCRSQRFVLNWLVV